MGRNIDGLVINATGRNSDYVAEISRHIPVILIHRNCGSPGFIGDHIDSDNEEGVYGLTRHLISFGHRRIFVIKGDKYASNNLDRFRGFCKAMAEADVKVDDSYPFQYDGDFSEKSGYDSIEAFCNLPARPSAILGFNNTMTLGALRGLFARNISVPDQVSIAGYNSIDNRELLTVRPTIHYVDSRELGLAAGKALLERLETHGLPSRKIIINGHMVSGNTVGIPTV